MPHTYVKKGNREVLPDNLVQDAIKEVKSGKGINQRLASMGFQKAPC